MPTPNEIDRQLFGQEMPERSMVGKGIEAVMDGLGKGIERAGNALYGAGMQHFVAHGSHEVANALFNGSAYVMYPRGAHDNGQEEVQQDHQQDHQQERGGREM